jgi:hypothetical protein
MNHADWMFYVEFDDGLGTRRENGAAGLQNMMDIPGVTVAGYDDLPMTVTAEGTEIAPSLVDFITDRPLHIDTLAGNWMVEAKLAQNATNALLSEPIIVRDGNLGRLIPVYQTNMQDDPKGAVSAEIIQWLMSTKTSGGPVRPKFYRADPNNDGACNITDGIYILNYLFLGGPQPTCKESADPNNDGLVNITDGIYVLNYLFLGGPSPLPPGPPGKGVPCGTDTDAEGSAKDLGCLLYTKC